MGENSNIEWTDYTFNPWIGCTKVSPGCANCYAESQDKFRSWTDQGWGKGKPRRRTSAANWRKPLKWNTVPWTCECGTFISDRQKGLGIKCWQGHILRRARVFCASLADWLDDEVPIEWLADLLKLIHDTPHLDWLLLTKRPENFLRVAHIGHARCATSPGMKFPRVSQWADLWAHGNPPKNIWIGASVEDQKRADERIPHLLKIPAKVRFLSVEPLLGPVNLNLNKINYDWMTNGPHATNPAIHWVIVGGESGDKARPCDVSWIRSIVQQCKASGTACFVKQLGRDPQWSEQDMAEKWYERFSDPKGGNIEDWPHDIRIRQFPACSTP